MSLTKASFSMIAGAPVNVLDFGADPTGVADSTAAFNLATQSTAPFSAALQKSVFIPDGTYKLNGTVYVRAGQTVRGSGHNVKLDCTGNTTSATFILGYGLISGVPTSDNSGSPIKLESFWTLGGNGSFATFDIRQAGFSIRSIFMTGPGIGFLFNGCADGIVSDIEIDQCLNGMIFTNSQNISITNFNIYLPRYAFTFNSSCNDIQISNGTVEYTQYASVFFGDSVSNIKAILFSNVAFAMNVQFTTFTGYVYSRATNVEAQFTGCSFRNMYGPAVQQDAGSNISLMFTGCVFDGTKTNAAYAQSTTSSALTTGVSGNYTFTGCEFKNLGTNIATINNSLTSLKLHGGKVVNCPQTRLTLSATDNPSISIKGVSGFASVLNTGTNQSIVLPFWGGNTGWKVAVKGNTQTSGNTNYSAAEEAAYLVEGQYVSSLLQYADKVLMWQSPNRAFPGQLNAVVCFGTVAGGATSQTFAQTGTICVSVPTSSASLFDWYAETII